MKKITLEIDVKSSDPHTIETQLIEAAKAKVPAIKKEVHIEHCLAQYHITAGKELGINFESMDDFIDRILPYASSHYRHTVKTMGSNGRRARTRITPELVVKMKAMAKPKRKAEIAREHDVAYIVVSNAIKGHYDRKLLGATA